MPNGAFLKSLQSCSLPASATPENVYVSQHWPNSCLMALGRSSAIAASGHGSVECPMLRQLPTFRLHTVSLAAFRC